MPSIIVCLHKAWRGVESLIVRCAGYALRLQQAQSRSRRVGQSLRSDPRGLSIPSSPDCVQRCGVEVLLLIVPSASYFEVAFVVAAPHGMCAGRVRDGRQEPCEG